MCLRREDLDSVTHCLAKHGVNVCKKLHVQLFLNREAARLPWKCVILFTDRGDNDGKATKAAW